MQSKRRKLRRANIIQAIILIFLFAAISVTFAIVKGSNQTILVFKNPSGQTSQKFYVDLANTKDSRQKGLMLVKNLDQNQGMLFIFPNEEKQVFWMKNTYLPLDMIFIGSDYSVVGLLENVPPLNTLKRSVESKSKYVLEVPANVASQQGIVVGSKLVSGEKIPEAR